MEWGKPGRFLRVRARHGKTRSTAARALAQGLRAWAGGLLGGGDGCQQVAQQLELGAHAGRAAIQALRLGVGLVGHAHADDYTEVNQLLRNGKSTQALARADAYLAKNARDPQMRFLKAVALTDSGKTDEAIAALNQLIEDYPELPEPYNNLAVVRAAQGNLEGARDALEAAIRSVPDYEVAYQNLGDLYLQLAAQRWRHAQKLAPSPVRATRLKALETLLEPSTDRSSGEAFRSVTRPAESAVRHAPAVESTTPRRSSPTE